MVFLARRLRLHGGDRYRIVHRRSGNVGVREVFRSRMLKVTKLGLTRREVETCLQPLWHLMHVTGSDALGQFVYIKTGNRCKASEKMLSLFR